jgi:hypothetical protein
MNYRCLNIKRSRKYVDLKGKLLNNLEYYITRNLAAYGVMEDTGYDVSRMM